VVYERSAGRSVPWKRLQTELSLPKPIVQLDPDNILAGA
jgi:hypothetical protein